MPAGLRPRLDGEASKSILRRRCGLIELIGRCERLEVGAGEVIVRSGDPADSMHFILDGRVGVMLPADNGGTMRVRSPGRCTTIGEMGLVSQAPRSATIQAEVASVLYVLATHQLETIKRERPALGQKLLTYFVTVMTERLHLRQSHDCGAAALGRPTVDAPLQKSEQFESSLSQLTRRIFMRR